MTNSTKNPIECVVDSQTKTLLDDFQVPTSEEFTNQESSSYKNKNLKPLSYPKIATVSAPTPNWT